MPIKILAPEIASQIAAGEVIERPASVVKELVENSLDASATQIDITIEGAGQRLVEVADDGQGIPAEEIALAVERHATSKLQSAEDLFHVTTLGFRGEALASIGSVSRLTMTSRQAGAPTGTRMRVDGGRISRPETVGAPEGTVVRVEDLFYNVPARLKFLKQDTTERRQIDTFVTRYALAYPNVRFKVRQEGRMGLQTSGNGDRREVLASLYGVEIARQMIQVLFESDRISVEGFASPTSLTRSNRREMIFYVNGRPIQDSSLSAAVIQAYHTMLMVGRFPQVILFITLPVEEVDVNVHPTKAEVKFRDSGRIFTSLQRAVRKALLAHTPVPGLGDVQVHWGQPGLHDPPFPSVDWPGAASGSGVDLRQTMPEQPHFSSQAALQPGILDHRKTPILRLIGQIASAYLAAEGPDGLYLIDQHAAHERVLYEKLMALYRENPGSGIPRQTLLQPVTVHLTHAGARLLADQLDAVGKLGFQVEAFGLDAFIVRSVPSILIHMDPTAALRVIVEEFEEDEVPLQSEIESRLAARICKRAAVKAGQTLSPEEQHALISDLEECESPRTCPHGRPTMIHISVDLLERQFGRRGPR
jgi:DNA mismatch repair protein MutL